MKLIISEKWKLVGYRRLPYILRPVSGGTDLFPNEKEFRQLTGCRVTAVGEESDDYLKPDEETCSFFTDRWVDRIKTVADGPFQAYIERKEKPN